MNYPYKIDKFLKDSPKKNGRDFFETEDGNFFGIGYPSPAVFVDEVNDYLKEVSSKLKPEDLFIVEDVRKVWGRSLDVPGDVDEIFVVTDGITERSVYAFPLYILVV